MFQESRLVIVIDSKNAERNARSLANELDSIERTGDFATKSTDRLSVATRQLAGYMAGIVTVSKAVSMADGYTQMAARIRNATEDAKEYDLVQKRLFDTANSTYRALSEAQEVYLGLSGGMKALGYATKDTLDVSDSLSFSFVANAARADQAQSAIDSFSKSMAKGKIDADAWISIVSAADNIIADMSKTTGMSEVQIRKLGAEGKISLEDLIRTLKETRDQNKALADSMENSLADGLTKLSNGVTRYLGELNIAMGVTGEAAGALGILADNIETVMDVAMLGGVAYLTKAIISQTTAMRTRIATSVVDRQASIAQLQAQYAEATAAANAAKAHLANVQATNAEATAKYGAVAANARYKLASDAVTVSVNAQTAAQLRLNAATSVAGRLAKGAFGLIGGWAGVATLGVTGLAAAYMYMQNRAEKANEKLKEQAQVADKTEKELTKLTGNDKKKAIEDLTAAFENQNKELHKSGLAVGSALISIQNYAKGNTEVTKISNEARLGTISYTEAVERLNKVNLPTELYEKLKETVKQYDQNAKGAENSRKALSLFGVEVKLVGNASQNAAVQQKQFNDSLEGTKNAAEKADEALRALRDNANKSMINDQYWINNYLRNKDALGEALAKDFADFTLAWRKQNDIGRDIQLSEAQYKILSEQWKMHLKIAAIKDQATAATREQTNEMRKQQQILQVNSKVQSNASKYKFSDIEKKYGLQSGMLSAIHMIESRGNANAYNKTTGATGGFQFLEGTAKQYGVKDRTDLAQSAEGAAKYLKYLLNLFKGDLEKAVRAYHAGEGNVQNGKNIGKHNNQYWKDFQGFMAGLNGYKTGDISTKDFEKLLDESVKMAEQQAQARIQLEQGVADQVTQIRHNLAEKIKEINAAGYSSEEVKNLISQYQERADNDIAIAQQAIKTKLDDFKQFTKSEEQLLRDSFAKRQFDSLHDIELTKEQRKEVSNLLDQQLKQELGLLKLAQEQRLFQAKQALLTETQAMQERYRLEREEIIKNTKLTTNERNRLIALSKANQEKENQNRINNSIHEWAVISTNMKRLSDQYGLDQERYSRFGVAQKLFDSQIADIEFQAQDPNANFEEMVAQRERIYAEHVERMKLIESTYQTDSLNLQLGYGANVTGALANMFGAMLGETSTAYRILYESQRAFALAQAGMNVWKSASDAYANEPGTWYQKAAAAAIATLESGTFVSLIQAATPPAFATGGLFTKDGYVRGPGTTTSDSINARLSDKEFVTNAWAVRKIGLENMEYMNRTGEIPQNHADGGYVSNSTAVRREARQFDAINQSKPLVQAPIVNIINQTSKDVSATTDWDGRELTVKLQEYQKQNEAMMDAKIEKRFRMASRQGGEFHKSR
ncbi:tape measure protein [Acinetobacter haemolyticus]|uniref:tape measure protein n=1 Tax=Acinetobacter haemolyticus TaxID=29430 RepID=UPI003C22D041